MRLGFFCAAHIAPAPQKRVDEELSCDMCLMLFSCRNYMTPLNKLGICFSVVVYFRFIETCEK
jgi:hypothetical protein